MCLSFLLSHPRDVTVVPDAWSYQEMSIVIFKSN
jgi:hypothetical protein